MLKWVLYPVRHEAVLGILALSFFSSDPLRLRYASPFGAMPLAQRAQLSA